MSDQTNKLYRFATTTPNVFIDVSLGYIKRRGYWLHCSDVTIEDGLLSMQLRFDGVGHRQVEAADRFNRKRLDQLSVCINSIIEETVGEVLAARGLTLAPQTLMQADLAACG